MGACTPHLHIMRGGGWCLASKTQEQLRHGRVPGMLLPCSPTANACTRPCMHAPLAAAGQPLTLADLPHATACMWHPYQADDRRACLMSCDIPVQPPPPPPLRPARPPRGPPWAWTWVSQGRRRTRSSRRRRNLPGAGAVARPGGAAGTAAGALRAARGAAVRWAGQPGLGFRFKPQP